MINQLKLVYGFNNRWQFGLNWMITAWSHLGRWMIHVAKIRPATMGYRSNMALFSWRCLGKAKESKEWLVQSGEKNHNCFILFGRKNSKEHLQLESFPWFLVIFYCLWSVPLKNPKSSPWCHHPIWAMLDLRTRRTNWGNPSSSCCFL